MERCGAHIASAGYSKDCSIANLKTTVERRKKACSLLIGGIDDKNHMIFYVSIYLHRMPNLCSVSRWRENVQKSWTATLPDSGTAERRDHAAAMHPPSVPPSCSGSASAPRQQAGTTYTSTHTLSHTHSHTCGPLHRLYSHFNPLSCTLTLTPAHTHHHRTRSRLVCDMFVIVTPCSSDLCEFS